MPAVTRSKSKKMAQTPSNQAENQKNISETRPNSNTQDNDKVPVYASDEQSMQSSSKETESLPAPSEKSKKTDNKKKVSTKPDDNGKGENEFAAGNVGGSDPNDQTEKDDDKNASTDAGGESSAKDGREKESTSIQHAGTEHCDQPPLKSILSMGDPNTYVPTHSPYDDGSAHSRPKGLQPGGGEHRQQKPNELRRTSDVAREESKPETRSRSPETSQAKEEENTNQPSKAGQLDRHTHQQEDIYSDDDDAAAYSEDSQPGKVERSKKKPSETTSNLGKEESKPRIRHRFPETSQPEEEENTNRPSKAGQRDKSRPQAEDAFSCDDDDDDDDGGGGDDDDVHEQASFLQGNINEHSRQGNVYFILILVVFLIAAVFAVFLGMNMATMNLSTHEPRVGDSTLGESSATMEILHRNMKIMEETFKGQSPRFWSVIETSLESIVARQPLHPSVIMIVSGPERSDTAKTIAQQVANSLQLSDNKAVEIHNEDIEGPDPAEVKFRLDELMDEALGGRSKAAVLYNIENIETSALSILFKYCDNVNAPHKDAVVVFTACMKEGFDPDSNLKEREEALEDFLIEHWKTMSSGKLGDHFLSPLMSRIGNSVAIVT